MADPTPFPELAPLFARLSKLNSRSQGMVQGYTSTALQCLEAAISMCEKFEARDRQRPALQVVPRERRG